MYLFAIYALFLTFYLGTRWLILELYEMIRVSHVVACPVIFILICDLVHMEDSSHLQKMVSFKYFGHCGPLPQDFRQSKRRSYCAL